MKINRSKKSNRRCWNCEHWDKARLVRDGPLLQDRRFHCDVADHDINYWNCCAYFKWNPEKEYKDMVCNS